MFLEEIARITGFMSNSQRSLDDFCRYLIIHTFRAFSPRAIYVGQIDNEGHLILKSSFGFEPEYIEQFKKIPLTIDIPLIEAIRSDEIIRIDSKEEFFQKYPNVRSLGIINEEWNSALAAPVHSVGAYFLVLNGVPESSSEATHFLRTIGHLISLFFEEPLPESKEVKTPSRIAKSLSPRQEIIKSLLSKGFTNAYIATEIGYSESLVRQETISIYAALNISGRDELIHDLGKK